MGTDKIAKQKSSSNAKRRFDVPMEQAIPEVCIGCKHHQEYRICQAFPAGKPEIILTGENNHRTNIDGDNGIKFESVEE